jgi:polysaccharide export outer membrane protein
MSDIIRSGGVGRCALALVVLFGSLVVSPGQEQTTVQSPAGAPETKEAAKQDAAKDAPKPDSPAAKPAEVPPSEAPATPATTATPPAAVAPQAPQNPPAASQPRGKGKKAQKKGKNSTASGSGEFTSTGVQKATYVIGPEDVLFLNVLHQQDVTQSLEVRPDGFVSVRFAGEIKAAGSTAQQLSDVIAEKLTVYFNHPEVNIQVIGIRSKKYYMSGEIRKPGAYPLTSPKTIYEAMIDAGGPADFAKKTKIYVLRSGQEKIPFNFKEVSQGKNLKQNILLENGDVVVVP